MNWLSRFFATRWKIRRLARDEKFWRERAARLEKERDDKNALLLELGFRWSDRFLTAQVKTYAITDEAKANINTQTSNAAPKEDVQTYLQFTYDKIMRDADEEGIPRTQAEAYYRENETRFIEEFQNDFGFQN